MMAGDTPQLNGSIQTAQPDITTRTIEVPTYTIIQADGLYPVRTASHYPLRKSLPLTSATQGEILENQIFTENPPRAYKVNYLQTHLFPTGTSKPKPWSDIPKDLRDQVDGIMVLKMGFTAEDVELFPRLKV